MDYYTDYSICESRLVSEWNIFYYAQAVLTYSECVAMSRDTIQVDALKPPQRTVGSHLE